MKPKSVLFFTYGYIPHNSPGVLRISKFAKYLSKLGWSSTVVTAKDGYTSRSGTLNHPEVDRSTIIRVDEGALGKLKRAQSSLKGDHGSALWSLKGSIAKLARYLLIPDRDVSWAIKAFRQASRNVEGIKPDVVLSTSPNPSSHLAASAFSRRHSVPHVVDFRDLWCASALYSNLPIRGAIERKLERWLLRHASAILVVSPGMREVLVAAYPEYAKKIHVVYNGFDPADFAFETPAPSDNVFRMLYAGSFYEGRRDPSPLLNSIKLLKDEGTIRPSNFRFDIYGAPDRTVHSQVEALGLEDVVHFQPVLSYNELTPKMMAADLLVAITFPSFEGKLEMTTKFFDYLGTGSEILTIAPDGFDLAVVSDQLGLARFSPQQSEGIRNYLRDAIASNVVKRRQKPLSRNDGRQDFTREAQTGHLAALMSEILDDSKAS
jgi:glycosyltransferase involved in cell wall biosynthesis